MDKWSKIAGSESINKASEALREHGIETFVVENGKEAVKRVFELIPDGAEVMTMSSVTLKKLGIPEIVNESGKYDSVKNRMSKMDRNAQRIEMLKLGAAPEYAIGSVHAVTEDGKVVIASNTGSQLPAYAYGSGQVIWIVGAQKIVKNLDEAIDRLYKYVLPLESDRLMKEHGVKSFVSKLLIINRELVPKRLTMIIIKEALGF